MLTSDAVPVAFRSDSVELVERGVDTVLRLRPARAGQAITPTSATLTLTDPAGTVVLDAVDATCANGTASYTVLGTTTADLVLGEDWQVTWSVVLPGETVARTVVLEAALVRYRLYPVVSDQDLFRRVSGLDPSGSAQITTIQDFSPYLDDAWAVIQERLLAKGDRPWLAMSPQSFREVHILLTLALVFEDEATRNNAYATTGADYRAQFHSTWDTGLRWRYDRTNGGTVAGAGQERKAPGGPVFLGGAPPRTGW